MVGTFCNFFVRPLALSGAALFAITLTNTSGAQAATTVCTAAWTLPDGTPGGTKSAVIQGSDPACPATPITATYLFTPTSDSGIAIGSPASTATDLSLTLDQPVRDPYFYASYFNGGESLTFAEPFAVLQQNGVTQTGLTLAGSEPDSDRNSGFVARFLGSYSTINFKYTNSNTQAVSFAITTGVTPVPGPLPILGVGAALGQARRLRRLSQQRRDRRFPAG
jgi:hypothetical protein